jgi:hypothetical protein
MEREYSTMLMAMYMRGTSKTIKLMATEFISIRTGPDMKENGLMIRRMDLAERNGRMELSTRVHFLKERSITMDFIGGLMPAAIMEFGSSILSRDMAFTHGQMDVSTLGHGRITNYTEMGLIHGQMEGNTKANILKIRSRGLVFTCGLMEDAIMVSGSMGNSMVKDSLRTAKVKARGESGTTVTELNGLIVQKKLLQ